jgi:hypothetical protein
VFIIDGYSSVLNHGSVVDVHHGGFDLLDFEASGLELREVIV